MTPRRSSAARRDGTGMNSLRSPASRATERRHQASGRTPFVLPIERHSNVSSAGRTGCLVQVAADGFQVGFGELVAGAAEVAGDLGAAVVEDDVGQLGLAEQRERRAGAGA